MRFESLFKMSLLRVFLSIFISGSIGIWFYVITVRHFAYLKANSQGEI